MQISALDLEHAVEPVTVSAMLPCGVQGTAGLDPLVVHVVARASGIPMTGPIRTMSFIDEDGASLFAAWHSKGSALGTSWIELSLSPGGLPLHRPVLDTMATTAFDAAHVDFIVVKLTAAQADLAPVLARLRFRDCGFVDGLHVFGLARADLPAYLRRRFARHTH